MNQLVMRHKTNGMDKNFTPMLMRSGQVEWFAKGEFEKL